MSIPVFLASDNNYAPFVASTMASMCDNTKSFIDFYILDGGITSENKERIKSLNKKFNNFSIEFIKMDLENEFKNFFTSGHISLASYSRFLIPGLKPNLKKVIYTDVDIIATGDIANLYNEDLGNYALAASNEEIFNDGFNIERSQRLGLSDSHKYFNAGILLMDCEKWREDNTTEKLLSIALEKKDILKGHDQDTLNIYFENNFLNISAKYCYLTECYDYGISSEDMIIRHYSRFKPWEINPELPDTCHTDHQMFWKYSEMTDFYEDSLSRVKINSKIDIIRKNKILDLTCQRFKLK